MESKKLSVAKIIFITAIVLTIVSNFIMCIAMKPTITQHTFPFSITYEIDGQTVTIQDEYICNFTNYSHSSFPAHRYYDGDYANDNEELPCGDYLIQSYEDGDLIILANFFAGYMMGDSQYADHYTEYYRFEPYVAFYVYEDYVEYSEEEYLAPYNVKIVDWDYPEPIENSMVPAGIIRLTRPTSLSMAAISLLALLACIFLVKRDRSISYGILDKLSIVVNFLIGFTVFPFLCVVSPLIDINGDASDPISISFFFLPAITCYGLAASVCLRRNGYRKSGFFVQFTSLAVLALLLVLEAL